MSDPEIERTRALRVPTPMPTDPNGPEGPLPRPTNHSNPPPSPHEPVRHQGPGVIVDDFTRTPREGQHQLVGHPGEKEFRNGRWVYVANGLPAGSWENRPAEHPEPEPDPEQEPDYEPGPIDPDREDPLFDLAGTDA